jgi:cytochrome c
MEALRIAAGIGIWALHFGAIYAIAAIACARNAASVIPWSIGAVTAIALVAALVVIAGSIRKRSGFAAWMTIAVAAIAAVAIVFEAIAVALVPACAPVAEPTASAVDSGRLLLRQFGCGTCHRIPGVPAADGNIGPSLERVARRVYLAGVVPNTRENMARFIMSPQEYDPRIAMPDMGVSESQARAIVDYLYTLR